MNYVTVPRKVFVTYLALKQFRGELHEADKYLTGIELRLGACEYAIPADVAL